MKIIDALELNQEEQNIFDSLMPGGENWHKVVNDKNEALCLEDCPYFTTCRRKGPDRLCSQEWRKTEYSHIVSEVLFHVFNNFDYYNHNDLKGIKKSSNVIVNIRNKIFENKPEYDEMYYEGAKYLVQHFKTERNQKIVNEKKKEALSKGKLQCEACGVDYLNLYGEKAAFRIVECHHTTPLGRINHNGTTKKEDLALLCANCHRLAHSQESLLSVKELKSLQH